MSETILGIIFGITLVPLFIINPHFTGIIIILWLGTLLINE